MSRRKALGLPESGRKKTLDALGGMKFVVGPSSPAEADYFKALYADEPTGNQREIIAGNDYRWRNFDSDRHPDLQTAVKTVKRFYNERIDEGGGLILVGHCGSGKSHLAQAVADFYGLQAVFVDEEHLVKSVQSSYSDRGPHTEQNILIRYRRAKLLVYDDLGAYQTDNLTWLQNIYYQLFDGRHEAEKATIITTNLPLIHRNNGNSVSPLEARLGRRCFSRLLGQVGTMDFYIDLFGVPDYRLRNLG